MLCPHKIITDKKACIFWNSHYLKFTIITQCTLIRKKDLFYRYFLQSRFFLYTVYIIESLLFQIICRSSWTGYHEAQSKLIRSVAISSSIFGNNLSRKHFVLHRIQNFRITISFQTFQPINVIKVIKVVILFLILEDEY